jgi:hypothetical protein
MLDARQKKYGWHLLDGMDGGSVASSDMLVVVCRAVVPASARVA